MAKIVINWCGQSYVSQEILLQISFRTPNSETARLL